MFGDYFLNITLQFSIIIILNAFDFWVVKNVTARMLIKLRYFCDIDDEGELDVKYVTPNNF